MYMYIITCHLFHDSQTRNMLCVHLLSAPYIYFDMEKLSHNFTLQRNTAYLNNHKGNFTITPTDTLSWHNPLTQES